MLEQIVANRREKVAKNKELFPVKLLESSMYFDSQCVSLSQYLTRPDKSGIIAEFKRASPSRGDINPYADVLEVTIGYMQSGASALSILTEPDYFKGKDDDLKKARNANYCPILRKDFIVDEYQVIETKSIGADAVLLIAACLEKEELKNLYNLARELGLEVLFEVHGKDELDKLPGNDVLVGVNNRDLKTMEVNIQTSLDLAQDLSKDFVLVSESGLSQMEDILRLKGAGYQGFLIGESLMRTPKPPETLAELVEQLENYRYAD